MFKDNIRARVKKRLELVEAFQRQMEDRSRRNRQEMEEENAFRQKVWVSRQIKC